MSQGPCLSQIHSRYTASNAPHAEGLTSKDTVPFQHASRKCRIVAVRRIPQRVQLSDCLRADPKLKHIKNAIPMPPNTDMHRASTASPGSLFQRLMTLKERHFSYV